MIAHLVDQQIKYWQIRNINHHDIASAYQNWNENINNIFIFNFKNEKVFINSKPRFYDDSQLVKIDANTPRPLKRALQYLEFLSQAILHKNLSLDFEIAFKVGDEPIKSFDVPSFAFQKMEFSPEILLPDIDIINPDLHHFQADEIPYGQKLTKAVFVGSTTGMRHTAESVMSLENVRLKNGVFFKDEPLVDFNLPNIVQCTDEVKSLIIQLGINQSRIEWSEQFKNKFIITMDGNGATCSRVFIALKSNSVLMKYASHHQLFYFPFLRAYEHFLPIYNPMDVLHFINMEKQLSHVYQEINANAKQFSNDYLCMESLIDYTSQVLMGYNQICSRFSL
jgi:hypothetical protein